MTRAGIYAGWVGFENLGDEAMFDICRERFPSVRWTSSYRLAYRPNGSRFLGRGAGDASHFLRVLASEIRHQPRLRKLAAQGVHRVTKLLGGEVGILGGGTLINRESWNLESYVALRKRTGSLVPVFGSGVASPEFWSANRGWRDTRKEWAAALAELPVAGVRGPYSMGFLQDVGAKNVVVCGDPAIAFHRRYADRENFERPDRPLRVAINTGECLGNLWGNRDDIHNSLVTLAMWLKQQKHHVELLPVWNKDLDTCRKIVTDAGLPLACVSDPLTSCDRFLDKVESFDLLVAVKLHASVLASTANVPCVVLEYQPKCRDFAASIDWEHYTIRTNALTADKLIDKVGVLIDELPFAKRRLFQDVSRLAQQFDEYCDRIEPLILGRPAAAELWSRSKAVAGRGA